MSLPPNRVLLVEDNSDSRYLATVLLEAAGYEVCSAADGETALASLDRGPFAFILLDLQLPDIDGCEVARRVRAGAASAAAPIIAVSAFTRGLDRRRAQEAGCTGYIEKPIDADCFVAQVRCFAAL